MRAFGTIETARLRSLPLTPMEASQRQSRPVSTVCQAVTGHPTATASPTSPRTILRRLPTPGREATRHGSTTEVFCGGLG
jgi:hypothetical protein